MKKVPASVLAAPSIAADVSVFVVSTTTADVSVSELPIPTSGSVGVSTEDSTTVAFTFGVSHATPSSLRRHRKQTAKKRVTPIVDVADVDLIKFDSASESDGDPSPYAPYAGWEMVPTLFGSIHAYYDMEEHTKHFTSLCELLHMVEKNDLRKLLGDVDKFYQRQEPETFGLIFWRLYPHAHVHVLETVDGRVIYMFVDVSHPLSEATLERILRHGLEVPKLLVGGDLTMAEQLVTQNWMVITFHVPFWNEKWLVQGGTALELASPEQTTTSKDVSNPFMVVMVCQKPLGYFSSPMIHVLRAGLVINPPGCCHDSTKGLASPRMDVKSAFLYKRIEEEVYVFQPLRFEDPDHPGKVSQKKDRPDLIYQEQKGDILLVQVYVDDIIFGSTKKELCTKFERLIKDKFQMSSMRELTFFIEKTLVKDADGDNIDVHLYRSIIGSLMYLTASRPEIIYLKGHPKLGLWYPRDSSFELVAYTDSDYVRASLDRKLTIRDCQFLGSRLISWQCKKQTVVATSTTETEYVAAASCYGEVKQSSMVEFGEMIHYNLTTGLKRDVCFTTAKLLKMELE
uniref:Reverse transcriptase Ty1/copia-type domain-containing protein n=1 Tax=Tanacetum cinerariifolium TaxID=118510 RepID=A0A699IC28_TANCI|nr:hypothetical protein [Tanacetum cinerariifolium]